jgi:hypothetical protein
VFSVPTEHTVVAETVSAPSTQAYAQMVALTPPPILKTVVNATTFVLKGILVAVENA